MGCSFPRYINIHVNYDCSNINRNTNDAINYSLSDTISEDTHLPMIEPINNNFIYRKQNTTKNTNFVKYDKFYLNKSNSSNDLFNIDYYNDFSYLNIHDINSNIYNLPKISFIKRSNSISKINSLSSSSSSNEYHLIY